MTTLFQRLKGDRVIWMTVFFLALISLLAVYSSISSLAFKREGGSTLHFLFKHGLMLASGGLIVHYASKLRYGMYSRLAQLAIWATAGLLLLTLILGSNINDASRWITIPIINQSFQTSDLAKVVLVVYLARVLGKVDLDQDAIVVVADHGHTKKGGHGGTEPEVLGVPLIFAGAGIDRAGTATDARLIDVAPTISALLGIAAPGHGLGTTLTHVLRLAAWAFSAALCSSCSGSSARSENIMVFHSGNRWVGQWGMPAQNNIMSCGRQQHLRLPA